MGASHTKLFIEQGAKVVLTDLNEEKGEALATELGENEEDWATVIEKTEETFGPANILVNTLELQWQKACSTLHWKNTSVRLK